MRSHSMTRCLARIALAVSALVLSVGVVRAAPAAPLGIAPGKSAADVLPAGTIVFFELPDIAATRARGQSNMLWKIWTDPQVQAYVMPVVDRLKEEIKKADADLQADAKLSFADIEKTLDGRLAAAVTDVSAFPDPGVRAAFILVPKDLEAAKTLMVRIAAALPEDGDMKPTTHKVLDVDVSEINLELPVNWAVAGNCVIVGIGNRVTDDIIQRMAAGGAGLSANPDFARISTKLAPCNQDWMYYISFDRIRALIEVMGGDDATTFLKSSGIGDLRAVGAAAKLNGPVVEDITYALFAEAPAPGRLQNVLTPNPLSKDLLRLVPVQADAVGITRFNVPFAYGQFVEALKQISPAAFVDYGRSLAFADGFLNMSLEDDLFNALGDEVIYYSNLPPIADVEKRLANLTGKDAREAAVDAATYEQVAVVWKVRDAERIRKSLKSLGDAALKGIEANRVENEEPAWNLAFVDVDYKNVKLRLLKGIPEVPMTPGYAVTDKYLIFAGSEQVLKEVVDRSVDPQAAIAKTPVLDLVAAEIDKGAGLVNAGDTRRNLTFALLSLRESAFPSLADLMEGDDANAPMIAALRKDPVPMMEGALKQVDSIASIVVKGDRDGVALTSSTGCGTGSLFVPAIVAVSVGAPLTMNLAEQAKSRKCARHVEQIAKALDLYMKENDGDLPASLPDLVPEYILDPNVLLCPAVKVPMHGEGAPASLTDYDYVGHLPPGVAKPDTIILCDRMGGGHMRRDNYLTYDLHVKSFPAWTRWGELPESYKGIQAWVEAQPVDVQNRIRRFYGMEMGDLQQWNDFDGGLPD